MKKTLLFIAVAFALALVGHGANVLWNFERVEQFVALSGGEHDYQCSLFGVNLELYADRVGTALQLFAIPDSNLEYANTFVQASVGDVVSHEYMANKGVYFSLAKYGDPGSERADYSIFVDVNDPVFLAFRQETAKHTSFGWVELVLNSDGELDVASSAWGGYDEPIRIGSATPEPSSGLLLLLGGALLTLRRRRGIRGMSR